MAPFDAIRQRRSCDEFQDERFRAVSVFEALDGGDVGAEARAGRERRGCQTAGSLA